MTTEERAIALVAVVSEKGSQYNHLQLGAVRLHTFYAGHGDEDGTKARATAEAYRQEVAREIASVIHQAVLAEREACAKLAESHTTVAHDGFKLTPTQGEIARAIRSRPA